MAALTQSQQHALVAGMAQTTTECCCVCDCANILDQIEGALVYEGAEISVTSLDSFVLDGSGGPVNFSGLLGDLPLVFSNYTGIPFTYWEGQANQIYSVDGECFVGRNNRIENIYLNSNPGSGTDTVTDPGFGALIQIRGYHCYGAGIIDPYSADPSISSELLQSILVMDLYAARVNYLDLESLAASPVRLFRGKLIGIDEFSNPIFDYDGRVIPAAIENGVMTCYGKRRGDKVTVTFTLPGLLIVLHYRIYGPTLNPP